MCCFLQVHRQYAANGLTAGQLMSLPIMFLTARNVHILCCIATFSYLHFLPNQAVVSENLSGQRILMVVNSSVQTQNFNGSTSMACREHVLSFLVRWPRRDATNSRTKLMIRGRITGCNNASLKYLRIASNLMFKRAPLAS